MLDLNEQMWGQTLELNRLFVNRTKDELTVQSVKASCGCTLVDSERYAGQRVPPSGSLAIQIVLKTELNPGRRERRVTVATVDGRSFDLRIQLTVIGTWCLSEDAVDFGGVAVGATEGAAQHSVHFLSEKDRLSGPPLCKEPWLDCRADPEVGIVTLTVLSDRLTRGQNAAVVIIRTSSALKPEGTLFVKAYGRVDISSSPEHVFLIGKRAVDVSVFDGDGAPVELDAVAPSDDAILAEITATGRVRVALQSPVTVPRRLSINVQTKGGLELSIPVSVMN